MSRALEKGLEKTCFPFIHILTSIEILEETPKLIYCFSCTEAKIQTRTLQKKEKDHHDY